MPAHAFLRALPPPLPVRLSQRGGEGRVWGWEYGVCVQGRLQGGRSEAEDRVGEEGVVVTFGDV